jgi:hypothetical protein
MASILFSLLSKKNKPEKLSSLRKKHLSTFFWAVVEFIKMVIFFLCSEIFLR